MGNKERVKHGSTHILGVIQWGDGDWLDVVHEQRVKVLQAGPGVVHLVLHKDTDRPQHEGDEEVHVDVVPGAVETPADGEGGEYGRRHLMINDFLFRALDKLACERDRLKKGPVRAVS